MLEWINENKEWLFSGIGVSLITGLGWLFLLTSRFLYRYIKNAQVPTSPPANTNRSNAFIQPKKSTWEMLKKVLGVLLPLVAVISLILFMFWPTQNDRVWVRFPATGMGPSQSRTFLEAEINNDGSKRKYVYILVGVRFEDGTVCNNYSDPHPSVFYIEPRASATAIASVYCEGPSSSDISVDVTECKFVVGDSRSIATPAPDVIKEEFSCNLTR
jgi:hypothetical protein